MSFTKNPKDSNIFIIIYILLFYIQLLKLRIIWYLLQDPNNFNIINGRFSFHISTQNRIIHLYKNNRLAWSQQKLINHEKNNTLSVFCPRTEVLMMPHPTLNFFPWQGVTTRTQNNKPQKISSFMYDYIMQVTDIKGVQTATLFSRTLETTSCSISRIIFFHGHSSC